MKTKPELEPPDWWEVLYCSVWLWCSIWLLGQAITLLNGGLVVFSALCVAAWAVSLLKEFFGEDVWQIKI